MRSKAPLPAALVFLLFFSAAAGAEDAVRSQDTEEPAEDPTDLVDAPTATVIPHASYDTSLKLYSAGGVQTRVRVGISDVVHFGVAFGGIRVLGSGDPDWNPRVEFLFKGLLLRESYWGPALALGFDSQGHGLYNGARDRYQLKSRGFYAALSKHFLFLGDLGFHGGVGYSLERGDDDEDPTGFVGMEKSFTRALDLLVEYDLATNDNEDDGWFGSGDGYLNAALLWRASERLHLEADFRNLLKNGEDLPAGVNDWSRELQLVYRQYF